ncbi:MAG TPA: class I adenylate-forming enzyme family protein, partial [Acidimicrobiales bacterium]|nr:class I adenylate-forming enzyme family protein [Acidimicrobiales bacterium]
GAAALIRQADGDRVCFCSANGLAFPVTLFGAVAARLPFVPLNYRLADAQLSAILDARDVVVASGDQADRFRGMGVTRVIDSAYLLDEARTAAPDSEGTPVDPDDVALLLHTSGTTAAPKAAVLRHRHLAAYVINSVEFGSAGHDEAALLSLPPYHVAGIMNLVSNLYMGRRIVYLGAFDGPRWLATVRAQSITHAMVVPTMLARIVSALDDVPADVPSLRTISYGGAKTPGQVIEKALTLFPDVAFTNAYGLTETSSTISVLGPDDHRLAMASEDPAVRARLSSAGQLLPEIEIEIRDDQGGLCAAGITGDIYVRGEQVSGEYSGVDGTGQGWFDTRDRGHLDASGYLFIEGRSDDTIIRGGENIAPAEIEDVLRAHHEVTDCAVVGIDDEEWGQRIAAAVIVVDDASVTPEDLKQFAKGQLRASKTPDFVVIVDELPYTETGKLLRRVVRTELSGMVAPSER